MAKSNEFDRDGDADVKRVATKTGPLGLVAVMAFVAALLFIIFAFFWFRT